MANPLYGSENFSTTLNVGGGINNSQTTGIVLTSVSGLSTNGGILGIDWASTIDTSTYEEIEYGGISGNELTGVSRGVNGTSGKAHSNGAVVAAVISKTHNDRLADKLTGRDATAIQDPNANEILKTSYNASAVNEVTVTNAATGNAPQMGPTGGDTDIDFSLVGKGAGKVKLGSGNIKFPNSDGSAGQFLKTDGAGALSFASAGTDGWVSDSNTWTYSSVDGATGIVTVNADLTGAIQAGDRIKFTQTTVKYFIVSKTPTFAAGSTTITFWGGTDYTLANAAISSPAYSHAKAPFGFNTDPTKWTVRVTDSTDRSQATAATSTWYNLGTTASQITIPIGTWDVYFNVTLQSNATAVIGIFATLSTGNNTESDTELTVNAQQSTSAFGGGGSVTKRKTITNTSKTTHYLNTMTTTGTTPTIYNRNSSGNGAPMIMEARSAFL